MKKSETQPLLNLAPGEDGTVETVHSGPNFISRMASMGLSPGARVTVTQNFPKRPLIINVRQTFIALGRTEAEQIYVGGGKV
jgi:Fe2+ transport system protein FeoA